MSLKRTASSLIIFYSLISQRSTLASSTFKKAQKPFGVSRSSSTNGNSSYGSESLRNSKSRSSRNRSTSSSRRDDQVSDNYQINELSNAKSAYSNSHSQFSNDSRSKSTTTKTKTATESSNSRLIQIPMSLTLQHASKGSGKAVPMSTFLDTGAQVTIMTLEAAKRAGIAHLIDTRYSGQATGVAGVSCRVLGRVPANSVSFLMGDGEENVVDMSPAITILEGCIMEADTIDMLLGMDVLEDWQAMICFRARTLTVRDGFKRSKNKEVVIPFAGGSNSQKKKSRKDRGSRRQSQSQSAMPSKSTQYSSSVNSARAGYSASPFARDASLLESELDALDERSGNFGARSEENDDIDLYDDYFTDDEDSYYSSESDYDEGSLSLGCDLSGI